MSRAGNFKWLVPVILMFFTCSCGVYSFTGASISPEIKTVTIQNFTNQSASGSIALSQGLTDKLKDKFLSETNLKQVSYGGDIEFKGAITGYNIVGTAPTANQTTAVNRLTITVNVEFTNRKNEKDSWVKSFSRYAEYESSSNLADVEDQLVSDINSQLAQDIFNQAFVNW